MSFSYDKEGHSIVNGLLRFARNDDFDWGQWSGFLRLHRKKPDHLLQKVPVIAKEPRSFGGLKQSV